MLAVPGPPAAARGRGVGRAHRRLPEAAAATHHVFVDGRAACAEDCVCGHGPGEAGGAEEDL